MELQFPVFTLKNVRLDSFKRGKMFFHMNHRHNRNLTAARCRVTEKSVRDGCATGKNVRGGCVTEKNVGDVYGVLVPRYADLAIVDLGRQLG